MRITIIGSGNVATHLAAAFKNAGHKIMQVYSRNLHHASLLAFYVGAEAIDDLSLVNKQTDLFIIAVNDDAIEPLAKKLAQHNQLIVHTSGATGLDILRAFTDKAGVFYPLQTLSKDKEVDFQAVPLCIEGADQEITEILLQLAHTVSQQVYQVDSAQRKILHLAAVFACNFPNYLYQIAEQMLAKHQMDFQMLRPLILETAQKVQHRHPGEVQTGPAVRKDEQTMAAHLDLLTGEPALKTLYSLLSQGIIKNK